MPTPGDHDRAPDVGGSVAEHHRFIPAADGGFIHTANGGRVGTGAGWPVPTAPIQADSIDPVDEPIVGVIDSGLITDGDGAPHSFLRGHATRLRGALDEDPVPAGDPTSLHGHGTFVCGVILRNAPGATLTVRRALLDENVDDGLYEDEQVAQAIRELVRAGATIINMSFQGVDPEQTQPLGIRDAMQEAAALGVLFVAAGGNDPDSKHFFPAEYADPVFDTDPDLRLSDHVIAVGAVDETLSGPSDRFAEPPPPNAGFSAPKHWIHATANGVNVLGPWVGQGSQPGLAGWARSSGTSFAAAIVTGRIVSMAHSTGVTPLAAAAELQLLGKGLRYPVYLLGADSPGSAPSRP